MARAWRKSGAKLIKNQSPSLLFFSFCCQFSLLSLSTVIPATPTLPTLWPMMVQPPSPTHSLTSNSNSRRHHLLFSFHRRLLLPPVTNADHHFFHQRLLNNQSDLLIMATTPTPGNFLLFSLHFVFLLPLLHVNMQNMNYNSCSAIYNAPQSMGYTSY